MVGKVGKVYLQAWVPYPPFNFVDGGQAGKSIEARIISDAAAIKNNQVDMWDIVDTEQRFFYYNCLERYLLHENDNARADIGFDHCNDCAIENDTWHKYGQMLQAAPQIKPPSWATQSGQYNILTAINTLTTVLNVKIKDRKGLYGHGHLFDQE
jgi:hypothetical protein